MPGYFTRPELIDPFVSAIKAGDAERAKDMLEQILSGIDRYFSPITKEDFSPVLYQNGVVAADVQDVTGFRSGPWVALNATVLVTGAGVAGQSVRLSLPRWLPVVVPVYNRTLGSIQISDASIVTHYSAAATPSSFVDAAGATHSAVAQAPPAFTAALAAGDYVSYSVAYMTTNDAF